ncbi:hypothetical protein AB0I28_32055 [Phytomonospora sp. NPDC050363]|uniref:hypothetical protein n=1 Tax=Phytomonospora sp. NPDC050363 TaxID=3155642 RepID=UPI0033CC09A9
MKSPYSLKNLPPDDPPAGVICPGLWTMQVRYWRLHTPRPGTKRCQECKGTAAWPCHSWLCYDGLLGDAVEASRRREAASSTNEPAEAYGLAALARA